MPKYTTSICRSITYVYKYEMEAETEEEAHDLAHERMFGDDGHDPIYWEEESQQVHQEDWVQDIKELTHEQI